MNDYGVDLARIHYWGHGQLVAPPCVATRSDQEPYRRAFADATCTEQDGALTC